MVTEKHRWLYRVPALTVVLLLYGLAYHKAYTIDDSLFLLQAQQIVKAPSQPFDFDLVWDYRAGRAAELSPSGVGMSYLLAPMVALGAVEPLAHLFVVLLLALAAMSMARVACRLGASDVEAGAAALLLVSMPACLGMAATVMPDIAAMTFGLLGIEAALAARPTKSPWWGGAAGLAWAMATLCRPHALLLVVIGALFRWLPTTSQRPRARLWHSCWPALMALALYGGVALATRDPLTAHTNLMAIRRFFEPHRIPKNLVGFLSHFVFAVPLTLPYLAFRIRKVAWVTAVVGTCMGLLCLWYAQRLHWWYAALMVGLSVAVFADLIREGLRQRDSWRLIIAGWLLAPLPVCVYLHFPPKFLLLAAPAVCLVLVVQTREHSLRWRSVIWGVTALGGLLLGLAIVRADADMAEPGRVAARQLIAPHVAQGQQVWYFGHWGFQWYAEQAGARPITPRAPRPQPGDIVVGSGNGRHTWLQDTPLSRLQSFTSTSGAVGYVLGGTLGAGFYSDHWGYLPWSYGPAAQSTFTAWQVMAKAGPAGAAE